MTPAARVAAAIEILDVIAQGSAAEQALTRWARASRYAGSKDRAAVRDHVFDVLRLRQTAECFGGGGSGRALMLGLLRARGHDTREYFTGEGHAPSPLSEEERAGGRDRGNCTDLWNLPADLVPELERSLGAMALPTAKALQSRAPTTLRVNQARASRAQVREQLVDVGITALDNPLCETALTITEGARKLRNSACYSEGLVELQDAASQAVVAGLPEARRCLDYCAGGGGKSLALADQADREVFAHDADPVRMRDLPKRAARAGCAVTVLESTRLMAEAPFDLVLCDVPCSGSGAWRRAPDAKWRFSLQRLSDLNNIQDEILNGAANLVTGTGTLVYATCSIFRAENEDRVAAFLRAHQGWSCSFERRFNVNENGDGFYVAHLTHV